MLAAFPIPETATPRVSMYPARFLMPLEALAPPGPMGELPPPPLPPPLPPPTIRRSPRSSMELSRDSPNCLVGLLTLVVDPIFFVMTSAAPLDDFTALAMSLIAPALMLQTSTCSPQFLEALNNPLVEFATSLRSPFAGPESPPPSDPLFPEMEDFISVTALANIAADSASAPALASILDATLFVAE